MDDNWNWIGLDYIPDTDPAPKILLISEYFPPKTFGGGEISAQALARGLAEKDLNVSVLTSNFAGLEGFEIKDGYKIYRLLKTGENPNSLMENYKRKNEFHKTMQDILGHMHVKYQHIHCLNNTSMVGCKTHIPTISTINSYSVFCPKGNYFYKELEECTGCNFTKYIGCLLSSEYTAKMKLKFYLKYNPLFWIINYWDYKRRNKSIANIKKFIVPNKLIRDLLIRNKVKKRNIIKIPNLMTINEKSKKKYPLEKKTFNVTYIGSLDKIKGIDLLIEAFNNQQGDDLRLLIVGEGPERSKLESIAGARVRFLGKLDYELMPFIYENTEIVVIPSKWPEPLSRVLLEATYYGKPIIATDVGGNKEGVIDGRNGYIVNTDSRSIEKKLRELIIDKKLRNEMGSESLLVFKERFNRDLVLDKIVDFYGIHKEG